MKHSLAVRNHCKLGGDIIRVAISSLLLRENFHLCMAWIFLFRITKWISLTYFTITGTNLFWSIESYTIPSIIFSLRRFSPEWICYSDWFLYSEPPCEYYHWRWSKSECDAPHRHRNKFTLINWNIHSMDSECSSSLRETFALTRYLHDIFTITRCEFSLFELRLFGPGVRLPKKVSAIQTYQEFPHSRDNLRCTWWKVWLMRVKLRFHNPVCDVSCFSRRISHWKVPELLRAASTTLLRVGSSSLAALAILAVRVRSTMCVSWRSLGSLGSQVGLKRSARVRKRKEEKNSGGRNRQEGLRRRLHRRRFFMCTRSYVTRLR